MKAASFEAIAHALDEAKVRHLVAVGLAVNAHGYLRFTKNVDLVVQLDPENIRRALDVLARLGYRPALPVKAERFADPEQRKIWAQQKGMQVFQLWSDLHRETPIDIFASEPFAFDQEYAVALVKPLRENLPVRFVTIETLIRMKQLADRPQDRIDIEHLRLRLEK